MSGVDERLHRDLFPVDVTLDGAVVAMTARVFITNQRVLVYAVRVAHGTGVTAATRPEMRVTSFHAQSDVVRDRSTLSGHLDVDTERGTLHINRSHGCGCGSPLRAVAKPVSW